MNSEQHTTGYHWLRGILLLMAVAAVVCSPWLGSLHIACSHAGEGPVAAHSCDLCAKIFASPAEGQPGFVEEPTLRVESAQSESAPALVYLSILTLPGRSPPCSDLVA